ncbi:hypothetical protein DCAR_0832411 [Daucus carota subsp. sativus]|uniref:RBR-type E3 ubiquitin transferase n=1 Tax=Daucus carota subsp. sativus TaxID=79200 RepID=A0AAF0XT86_DAUCS|nr:hypothetical protein DCAR_0832411 [Daucus carota subsp. sativus]
MGATKENAISVETYRNSMQPRNHKKRFFIDLNRATQETHYEDVHVLDSFPFPNRNPRRKITLNSTFEAGESSNTQASTLFVCEICVDEKSFNEAFSINGCTHSYCTNCIVTYIASKLQDNITQILCPVPGCRGLLEPEDCRLILPLEVFDRWGKALCEAVIFDWEKFYCPYKDCSAMLIDDGMVATLSNCQYCERDFCANCRVPWHLGVECLEFQSLSKDEREAEDLLLMQLAKNRRWKRCPGCKIYIDKYMGCSAVRCRYFYWSSRVLFSIFFTHGGQSNFN